MSNRAWPEQMLRSFESMEPETFHANALAIVVAILGEMALETDNHALPAKLLLSFSTTLEDPISNTAREAIELHRARSH